VRHRCEEHGGKREQGCGSKEMTDGQHLALGLIFVILMVRWLLPDSTGKSKLIEIIGAAFGPGGSSGTQGTAAVDTGRTPSGGIAGVVPGI
jgi:hypothetical protein